jgi:hypothetical protein
MNAPSPLPPSPVDDLVAAYRAADDRNARLDGRSPFVRLVIWPCAALAVILIGANVHGPLAW